MANIVRDPKVHPEAINHLRALVRIYIHSSDVRLLGEYSSRKEENDKRQDRVSQIGTR